MFAVPFVVFFGGNNGAPDWIEIVSPSSRKIDYYKKLLRYHIAGLREHWGWSRETMVTVYNFELKQ